MKRYIKRWTRTIWKTIREGRKKLIGHIMRNKEWITTILEEGIEGKHGGCRPKTLFMKQIIEDIKKTSYNELKIAVRDK